MIVWVKLALRDIIRHKRFTLFFILNMAVGLTGLIAVGSLGHSFDRFLDQNLREMLTADLMISSSQPISKEEGTLISSFLGKEVSRSDQVSLYSMVQGNERTLLARILGVDARFPLYGNFYFSQGDGQEILSRLQRSPTLLMERATAQALQVKVGDQVTIGEAVFEVLPFFDKAPGASLASISLAPQIYVAGIFIEKTGLLQFGSRIGYRQLYKLAEDQDAVQLGQQLRLRLDQSAGGKSGLRVFGTRDVHQRLGKLTEYFLGYLNLVGVVALFLAGIAGAYLFQGYVHSRLRDTAILMSLGSRRKHCILMYLLQLGCLGAVAALGAILISSVLLPYLPQLMGAFFPEEFPVRLNPVTGVLAFALGTFGSFVFCLPVLAKVYRIQVLTLLQSPSLIPKGGVRLLQRLAFIPALMFFALLSVYLTGSFVQGGAFTGGVVLVIGVLSGLGVLLLGGLYRLSRRSKGVARVVLRNLYRNKLSSLSVFVTIGAGVFLINIIPQIQAGIQQEISQPKGLQIPALFLIDIQPAQKEEVISYFHDEPGVLTNISPMVRGRIQSVNGVNFFERKVYLQRAADRGLQRTEFNFSSRPQLDASEKIIAGRPLNPEPWVFGQKQPFEISMAAHFAERHQIELGDRIIFDIQGITLEGQVVNFRKVRWVSFQPNFFLLFQTGVLDQAPKTYLASVAQLTQQEKEYITENLVQHFPNISTLDVSKTVGAIVAFSDNLLFALRSMAYLALFVGMVALYSIARNEALYHEQEMNVLKILGTGLKKMCLIVMAQFGILGLSAGVIAVFLSTVCSFWVSWFFFDHLWASQIWISLFILLLTMLGCMVTGLVAAFSVMRKKPIGLLG